MVVSWMLITSLWLTTRAKRKTLATVMDGMAVSNAEQSKRKILWVLRAFISHYEPLLSMLFILSGLAMVYAFLVTRHPPVLWPDVRPTYYIMPAQAVLLITVATLLARARIKWILKSQRMHYIVIVLSTFFLLGNVIGSIQIKNILLNNGDNMKLLPHDAGLLDALAQINSPGFEPNANIATDPIYQLFSQP